MASDGSTPQSNTHHILCTLLGHKAEFTEEYKNQMGHVQANEVCTRCGQHKIAWTGPPIEEIPGLEESDVPSKEDAINEVLAQ